MNDTFSDRELEHWIGYQRVMAKPKLPDCINPQFIPYQPKPQLPWYDDIKAKQRSVFA